VTAYQNDPLVGKQFSAGLLYSLAAGVEWNKQNANRFSDPVLVLHGSHDGLVSEKDSRDFFGEIASKDKSLIIYAHLFHEIFNEPSKDEVIGDAIAWLEKRI
jgi:lysophospholipase